MRCSSARSAVPTWPSIRATARTRSTRALRGLDDLDDAVEVWPGHIGGSLCGGANLSQKPSSTLGYERRANPYLAIRDEDAFVDRLVGSLPAAAAAGRARRAPQPRTRALPELREPPLLGTADLGRLLAAGGVGRRRAPGRRVRCRPPRGRRSTCRSAGGSIGTRAGWLIDAERPLALYGDSEEDARRAHWMLAAVGLFGAAGSSTGTPETWRKAGLPVRVGELDRPDRRRARLRGGLIGLLDVRDADEWERLAIPGAQQRALWQLGDWRPVAPSSPWPSSAPPGRARRSPRAPCARACRSPCCASTAAWPTCSPRSRASRSRSSCGLPARSRRLA